MSSDNINPQVRHSITTGQQAALTPNVATAAGAGKAYQSVAQSAALAIQDATDNLRSLETVANTAIGVALGKYLKDPTNTTYPTVIKNAQGMVTQGATQLANAGKAAKKILGNFPTG